MKKVRTPKDSPAEPPTAVAGIHALPVRGLGVELEPASDKIELQILHEWSPDVHTYLLSIPAAKVLVDMLQNAVQEYLDSGELDQELET